MKSLFKAADILVDATQRRDSSQPVVPNEWIAWLPEHSVVVDLAVDPYTLSADPPVVRGVEGIPQGNLDQYIFHADDLNWDKTVPSSVNSKNRRTTVTCYSWPGVHPEACMLHYAQQLKPFVELLFEKVLTVYHWMESILKELSAATHFNVFWMSKNQWCEKT